MCSQWAASVTRPGGIRCHGDLGRCCCGDGDERRQSRKRHFWLERDQQNTGRRVLGDRDDHVQGHCSALHFAAVHACV